MGTRNLTCVVKGGEVRVAKYCQWDGYPSGQGITVLEFLRDDMDLERFEHRLDSCRFCTEEELEALWESVGADGSGMVSYDVADEFMKLYPQMHRDVGGDVLSFIQESGGEVLLDNGIDFAQNGLFCAYAYVVDLDNGVLEVYRGYQDSVPEDNRFGSERNEDGYLPVGLVKTYQLNDLPDNETFVSDLGDGDEED